MDEQGFRAALREALAAEGIEATAAERLIPAYAAIGDWLLGQPRPLFTGICGPQGSGKSTMSVALAAALQSAGLQVAVISLDDFYLSHAARQHLAATVHPLFATRGVPGTHDVALAIETLDGLRSDGVTPLPRFDKASDDPFPADAWPQVEGPVDIVLLEGWCVGAHPQAEAALAQPINALERDEDRDGAWRHAVNAALAGPYQALFARLDRLFLIEAPSFDCVFAWRREQERKLIARAGKDGRGIMDDAALARFIMHYERLTRHIIAEMPARADGVLKLGPNREVESLRLQ